MTVTGRGRQILVMDMHQQLMHDPNLHTTDNGMKSQCWRSLTFCCKRHSDRDSAASRIDNVNILVSANMCTMCTPEAKILQESHGSDHDALGRNLMKCAGTTSTHTTHLQEVLQIPALC